jgi:MFS family permease
MSTVSAPLPAGLGRAAWFATIAGLCGSLVAIGLARFAYTPLVPALIEAGWFSAADTVGLGAANFAGYLAGAFLGRRIAAALGNRAALRLLMVLVTAAFFACAWPLSIGWFFAWRFVSGVAGGAIMVLGATSILPNVPASRRGFVGGVIFLGVGLGIAASGLLVPPLLRLGLRDTWIGLGVLSLALTAVSWLGWPRSGPQTLPAAPKPRAGRAVLVLYGQYAANAFGLVPAMVLLVDYVARGLGRGAEEGAVYWVLYGLAAIGGPVLCGMLGDRFGFRRGYRWALAVQAVAVAVIAVTADPVPLVAATLVLGALTPGIVPLVLGRIQEVLPGDPFAQRAAWSRATTAFALLQAAGGYLYAFLFAHSGEDYRLIFLIGAGALAAAWVADVTASHVPRRA